MLPAGFRDFLNNLVSPSFDDCRDQLEADLLTLANTMNARGMFQSSIHADERHKKSVEQMRVRVGIVWDCLQQVVVAKDVQHSESLAAELKAEVEYYVPLSLWELPATYTDKRLNIDAKWSERLYNDLLEKRSRELKKVGGQIDLYVADLKAKQPTAVKIPPKEHHQKFPVLLSPAQALKDFEQWQSQLGPANRPISILFVDVDNFKPLNTKYSETKVDQTILPQLLNLIENLVRSRGEAYLQGGDEIIVILPNHDTSDAQAFGEKLRAAFKDHQFAVGDQTEGLTLSIGVASWPDHGLGYEEVLQKANDAMRIAKKSRDSLMLASPREAGMTGSA